jgi:hypothetical protein
MDNLPKPPISEQYGLPAVLLINDADFLITDDFLLQVLQAAVVSSDLKAPR